MARVSIKGSTKVRVPPQRASFVLGSRPPALRSPRIKPAIGVSQYGKQLTSNTGIPQIGGTAGDTGRSGES